MPPRTALLTLPLLLGVAAAQLPSLEPERLERAVNALAEPLDDLNVALDMAAVEALAEQLDAPRRELDQAVSAATDELTAVQRRLADLTDDQPERAEWLDRRQALGEQLAAATPVLDRADELAARFEKRFAQALEAFCRAAPSRRAAELPAVLDDLRRWQARIAPHREAVGAELTAAEQAVEREANPARTNRVSHLRAALSLLDSAETLAATSIAEVESQLSDLEVSGGLDALITQLDDDELRGALELSDLNRIQSELARLRAEAGARRAAAETERASVRAELDSLGDAAGDTAAQRSQRAELTARLDSLDAALARHDASLRRADAALGRVQAKLKTTAARALVELGPSIAAVLEANLTEPRPWLEFAQRLTTEGTGYAQLGLGSFLVLAVAVGLGIWLGRAAGRRLTALAAALSDQSFTQELLRGAVMSTAVHAPWLAGFGVLAAGGTLLAGQVEHPPFVVYFAAFALGFIVLRTGIRAVLAPFEPARSLNQYPPELEYRLARGLSVLGLLILLNWLIIRIADEFALAEPQLYLVRFLFLVALSLDAGWLVWLESRLTSGRRTSRWLALTLLAVALLAEAAGFRALAGYLQQAVILTLLAWLAYIALRRLLGELFDRIDQGTYAWARRLRETLSIRPSEPFPGLPTLRFVTGLLVYVGGGLALLRIWLLEAGYTAAVAWLNNGFSIGGLTVVPWRLLQGLLLFGLLLTLRSWTREALSQSLTRHSRMDRGARDATLAIANYVFFAVAVLMAVRVIGPELLRNVAVVMGALSVGIGFGLQNIVNNFVSGLILLFERQIKTGDWIVVGATEGYVRRLNVRSTEIQTFTRAEVIVPNADLLQQHVINKTRHSPVGRVEVPVGVAYGTDTALVRELLLELGRAHPEAAVDSGSPTVLFMAFGESSLDFELRLIIRDVDKSLSVRSDLLFAIDAAFREHGIEIPFPQRVVEVKSGEGGE